ncbi:hypothetical protein [Streptomyces scabiei]|uniref:hypothetical protein n=1 Tax=Streptomyces scabiei TaxID=1930 RepID=UPI0038F70F24
MTKIPCPGPCPNGVRGAGQYLCFGCWCGLTMAARRALKRRNPRSKALARLQELHRQLRTGVPLAEIQVSP